MGSFKISLFLDFEPSLRLSSPFVVIIITNTFSIFFQSTPTNANIEDTPSSAHTPPPQGTKSSPLRPSLAVFIGILTILLGFTFLILLYAKHCRGGIGFNNNNNNVPAQTSTIERHNSGVDRTVVESLPLFRFKSLKGHKDGLECAVCLNKFEPTEVLRLLPKCKHAFHIECVDTWLDCHSTCPLCRYQVHPEDILLVNNSRTNSSSSTLSRIRVPSGALKSPASTSSSPPPPPLTPNQGGGALSRHSSGGESRSSSLLEVIIEKPSQVKRNSTTSLISSQKSLDSTSARSSFNKKLSGGVYKWTPAPLSSTRSLDSGGESSADPKRKDGLLLDSRSNSPGSISSSRIQEKAAKPPTPKKQRHSSGGESSKTQRANMPFSCNSKRSLDSSKSFNKQPNNTNTPTLSRMLSTRSLDSMSQSSADQRRKDGLLLLAEKRRQNEEATDQHRLEHKIIVAGAEMESSGEEEVLSDDMLYLQTDEMMLSDESRRLTGLSVSKSSVLREESKSSDERKVNDDRSVSEMTGLSRFRSNEEQQRSNNYKRQNDNVGWAVSKWKAWISATKHNPSSPSVSTSSSNVV